MSDFLVRRARREDLPALAALHNAGQPSAAPLDAHALLRSLAETGYLLAWQGPRLVGALAWNVENLVAGVSAAYLAAGAPGETASRLLTVLEAEARLLSCEVVLVGADGPALAGAAQACNFTPAASADLPPAWREAAQRLAGALWHKPLLAERVRRPL